MNIYCEKKLKKTSRKNFNSLRKNHRTKFCCNNFPPPLPPKRCYDAAAPWKKQEGNQLVPQGRGGGKGMRGGGGEKGKGGNR